MVLEVQESNVDTNIREQFYVCEKCKEIISSSVPKLFIFGDIHSTIIIEVCRKCKDKDYEYSEILKRVKN